MSASVAVPDMVSAPPCSRSTTRPVLRPWLMLLLTGVARTYVVVTVTLACAAVLPALGSWSSYVVQTGSMAPAIRPGDVVAAAPLARRGRLPLGRVVTFTDPVAVGASMAHRVIVHRVVEDHHDGTFATKGDANRSQDSTPVPRGSFLGRGRLLVPWVGRPALWATTGRYPFVALFAFISMFAIVIGFGPSNRRRRRQIPQVIARLPERLPRLLGCTAFAIVVFCIVMSAAAARFTGSTMNAGNSWQLTSRILLGYDTQVLADAPYAYYRLDDASGPTMTDASGNANRIGTYSNVSAFRQSGAMTKVPDYAVGLNGGGGRLISGGSAITNPTTFSLELWFKTTTATGGKLAGFESTQQPTSPLFDRHVFMRNDGRLTYGGWGTSARSITTSAAYNDGKWHQLVLTARPIGGSANQQSTIYVDGTSVAAGNTSGVSSYAGWWRAGYGSLGQGSGYPASADFTGSIDNFAIYNTELSPARVAAHLAAR